jgi:DNA-binding winged helix-turn-helix (wHTH) protein
MAASFRFGVYELDRDVMELRKHGVPVRLQEQPCRVLAILAERPGELVTREELQAKIWGDTFVDFDHSLNRAVNRIREALNDNAGTPQYVQTVPRRGYRFIAPVAVPPPTEAPKQERPGGEASTEAPARPAFPRSRSTVVVFAGSSAALLIAAIGLTTALWFQQPRQRPRKHELPQIKLVNSFGLHPTLSRAGKLLAYQSSLAAAHRYLGATNIRFG